MENIEKEEFAKTNIYDIDADVYDLEVTRENFEIIKKRIEILDDFYAYQILIFDFDEFLSPENRRKLISDAKELFDEELTKDWD